MKLEHLFSTFRTWGYRVLALLMMWIGLFLLSGPINYVFELFPPSFSGCLVYIFAVFPVAFILWLITICAFAFAHSPLLSLGGIAVVGAAIWALSRILPRERLAKAYARTGAAAPRAQAQLGKEETSAEEEAIWRSIEETAPEKIQFECKECGKHYTVKASLAGRKARCKECGHTLYIPTEFAN